MTTWHHLLNRLFKPHKQLIYLFGLIAILGLLDATYLTILHYRGVLPSCNLVVGCENVLTSNFATFAAIPVALLGTLFYLSILICTLLYLDTKKLACLRVAFLLTIPGLLASLYFLYLQAFVIHYYCQYCLFSLFTSTILFAIAMYNLKRTE